AFAHQVDNTDGSWNTNVYTEDLNNDPQAQAEMLQALGLFLGTDKGFELNRQMTRCEGAAMLVRFLGKEAAALAGDWEHPFSDVPEWADKYVGWLYEQGLTRGVSAGEYGAAQSLTLEQYAIFLSRALYGSDIGDDAWKGTVAQEEEAELWDRVNGMFNRDAAVGLSVRVLSLYHSASGSTLAQYLADQGVFTAEELGEAAWNVLPSSYGGIEEEGHAYVWRKVAGVPVAKCPVEGLYVSSASQSSPLDYLHGSALRGEDAALEFYQIDARTMEVLAASALEAPGCLALDYLGTAGGKDYLMGECPGADGSLRAEALYVWDGESLSVALSAGTLWGEAGEDVPYAGGTASIAAGETLALAGARELFFLSEEGIKSCPVEEGTELLGFDGLGAVTQLILPEATVISCISAASAAVTASYTAEADMEPGDYGYERTLPYFTENGYYYGEAGLYRLREGVLSQLSSRPAADLLFVREGADSSDPIILTHEPGVRIWGMNTTGGNMIVRVGENGEETVLLSNEPAHGIAIAGFFATDSAIVFYSEKSVGMQNADVYTYVLAGAPGEPVILVTDFSAGRPETMEGFSWEDPEGYAAAYIQAEQARLDRLGLGM
ncbi:MAG: S-layer homology domain-containing protein, partial [Bacillota bacterium]|nr:S-layer homology domain-containing protein [Bacillota bacterium]